MLEPAQTVEFLGVTVAMELRPPVQEIKKIHAKVRTMAKGEHILACAVAGKISRVIPPALLFYHHLQMALLNSNSQCYET